ncbi:MAG TPA: hypothetical protein VGM69_19860 [Chloroflexota bacterium]|jgi:cell division protein FtsB
MAFTVRDFRDLVQLLEQRPEWRSELRRLVLTEELLELPAIVRELAGRLDELAARVDRLAEAQERTEARVAELAEAQRRTESSIRDLAFAQGAMREAQEHMRDDLGALRGEYLESRYRNHAGAYLARLVRRARVVADRELTTMLDDALDAGQITRDDRDEMLAADLVVWGRRWEDGREVYLVAEVSVGIWPDDVLRAVDRARVLAKLHEAVPVVAGERISSDAEALARERGVMVVLDGRTPRAG